MIMQKIANDRSSHNPQDFKPKGKNPQKRPLKKKDTGTAYPDLGAFESN